jgi:hypothetical protein
MMFFCGIAFAAHTSAYMGANRAPNHRTTTSRQLASIAFTGTANAIQILTSRKPSRAECVLGYRVTEWNIISPGQFPG